MIDIDLSPHKKTNYSPIGARKIMWKVPEIKKSIIWRHPLSMKRKGGDTNGVVVKNLDTIITYIMEKCKKCEDSCTCDPNVNELGDEYSMPKTTCKEKEQGYGIRANNNPSEQKFAIVQDDLSLMGEAVVYRAASEAQSRFNNDFGHRVDKIVTRRRSKWVSEMH